MVQKGWNHQKMPRETGFWFFEISNRFHVGDTEISVIKVGGFHDFHVMESQISNGRQSVQGQDPMSIFVVQAS
jgi:hypothetical protein